MGRCVYCLAEVPDADLTKDHVIARSWYPANTPPIEKWKVPACGPCNNRYSASEGDLLGRLALCMDRNDPALTKIVETALRSFNPTMGRDGKDIARRLNRKLALRRDVKDISSPHSRGLLPAFKDNFDKGSRTGIYIDVKLLNVIVEKWIRGVHFCELGTPVPDGAEIDVQFVEDEVAEEAFREIRHHAKHIQKGPGVEALIWHVEEGEESMTQYAFNIWGQFRVYGSVEKLNSHACR